MSLFHGHSVLTSGPSWSAFFQLGEAIRKVSLFLSSPSGQMGTSHPRTEGETAGKTVLAFSSPPFAFTLYQGLKLNPCWERGLQLSTGFGVSQWVQIPLQIEHLLFSKWWQKLQIKNKKFGGNVKWCSSYGKRQFLKKLNIEWPYDPAIPLQCTHPKEMKAGTQTDMGTLTFTAALFTIAKDKSNPGDHWWMDG